jgi:aspartate/methionine/tyrosine aminotransferase
VVCSYNRPAAGSKFTARCSDVLKLLRSFFQCLNKKIEDLIMNKFLSSSRARQLSPFIVMEVLEKAQTMAAQGEDIIHLEVGEPDFATPEPVKEAAIKAMQDDDPTTRTASAKLPCARKSPRYYWRKYGVEISPEQVIITSGTSPGMLLVFSALLEKGEEIILPTPIMPVIQTLSAMWTDKRCSFR